MEGSLHKKGTQFLVQKIWQDTEALAEPIGYDFFYDCPADSTKRPLRK
jgi:hypothetical protein